MAATGKAGEIGDGFNRFFFVKMANVMVTGISSVVLIL